MKLELSHAKDPSPISCMYEEPYIRKCQQSGSQNHLQPFEVVGQFLRWGGDITPLPFSFHFISLVRRQTNPYIFPLFVELESFKVKISSNYWRMNIVLVTFKQGFQKLIMEKISLIYFEKISIFVQLSTQIKLTPVVLSKFQPEFGKFRRWGDFLR